MREMILLSVCLTVLSSSPSWAREIACRWSRLGTDGGGYVTNLAMDKSHPDTIYCGSDKGGVHRSDDGGQTWKICTTGFDRETFYGVSGILPDDKYPGRVFALSGTGSARKFFIQGGLWRSDDRGEHWRMMTKDVVGDGEGDGKMFGHVLEFDPANHNIIYSISWNNGLWISRDAGQTWTQLGFAGRYPTGVWVDPDSSARILVALRTDCFGDKPQPGGLFESMDGGKTWKKILDAPDVTDVSRHSMNRDWLAACDGQKGLYLSRDRGKSWAKLPLHPSCAGVRKVRWHIGKGNRLWTVGGEQRGIFYTEDFGKTWTWPTEDIEKSFRYPQDWYMSARHAGWTAMTAAADMLIDPTRPDRMYTCDFYTPILSTDGGKTWSQRPRGMNTLCNYQIVCDPKDPNIIYDLNADVGLLKSTDGGKTFFWPIKEGEFTVNETTQLWVSPKDNRHLIVTVTYDWKHPQWTRVGISRDGGVTWDARWEGLPFNSGGDMTGLAVLDDDGRQILVAYSGAGKVDGGVYRSLDGGRTWENHSGGLPKTNCLFGSGWGCLPNLVSVGDMIYAGTCQGVYASNRKGKTWWPLAKEIVRPGEAVRTLAVDARRPDWLWVGTIDGLYVSRDRGKTVSRVGPKEMQRCQGVAIDPFDAKRWYVAVSQPWWGSPESVPGVYVTTDDGKTWNHLADTPSKGLEWHITCDPHRKGVIYVGMTGTGSWRGEVKE